MLIWKILSVEKFVHASNFIYNICISVYSFNQRAHKIKKNGKNFCVLL